jgi:drug/metabolite transporter (DMT)-like permease
MRAHASPGVLATLLAAALFGAGTPLAKLLLAQASPWLLAALLYLGSGVGLFVLRLLRSSHRSNCRMARASGWRVPLCRGEWSVRCC